MFDNLEFQTNFATLDWCIVIAYLLAVVAVGVYVKRYVLSVTDFMIAGRGLKPFLAIATMIGTELGLVTVMYAAQKGFTGGFAAFHIALMAALATLMVAITGLFVVPLRKMKVITIPEFYEKRFSRGVRIIGGIILVTAGIVNMGLYLKAGAVFVQGVTGLTAAVHLKIIMTVLLAMVLLYTTLGGMVSVVVLDYIQFVVLSFSLLATCLLAIKANGWTGIVEGVKTLYGEAGFNPLHEEGFGISYAVWMFLTMGLISCAVWPTAVVRALAADSVKTVRKLYFGSSVGFMIRLLLPYFLGISALVYVSQHMNLAAIFVPDGVPTREAEVNLMAMPMFLANLLPTGLLGFICAGMLAAFMSTHDSYLLCWSSAMTQDVVAPWFKKGLSSKARMLLTRIFIVAIGLFILFWGLWYPMRKQDMLDYMVVTGAIYGSGAIALMAGGLYWKRASTIGAYLAIVFGSIVASFGLPPVRDGVLVGLFKVDAEITQEYATGAHCGLASIVIAILVMVIGSLIWPNKREIATENEE